MDQRMLQKMMQQAQQLQKKVQKEIEEFENKTFEHVYGADHIKIEIKGNLKIEKIEVNKDLLEDQDMMQDLLVEALNEVISLIEEEKEELQAPLKGLGI